jgi:hypothetical protein
MTLEVVEPFVLSLSKYELQHSSTRDMPYEFHIPFDRLRANGPKA